MFGRTATRSRWNHPSIHPRRVSPEGGRLSAALFLMDIDIRSEFSYIIIYFFSFFFRQSSFFLAFQEFFGSCHPPPLGRSVTAFFIGPSNMTMTQFQCISTWNVFIREWTFGFLVEFFRRTDTQEEMNWGMEIKQLARRLPGQWTPKETTSHAAHRLHYMKLLFFLSRFQKQEKVPSHVFWCLNYSGAVRFIVVLVLQLEKVK